MFLSTLSSTSIPNLYLKHATLPPIGNFADCLMSCPICATIELLLFITEYTNLRIFLYNISSIDLCPLSGPTRKECVWYDMLNIRLAPFRQAIQHSSSPFELRDLSVVGAMVICWYVIPATLSCTPSLRRIPVRVSRRTNRATIGLGLPPLAFPGRPTRWLVLMSPLVMTTPAAAATAMMTSFVHSPSCSGRPWTTMLSRREYCSISSSRLSCFCRATFTFPAAPKHAACHALQDGQ